jgi:hypothetical protein
MGAGVVKKEREGQGGRRKRKEKEGRLAKSSKVTGKSFFSNRYALLLRI